MIGKQEVKKPLFDRIGDILNVHGFIKNIARQGFLKKTAFGHFAFHLAFVDRGFHIGVVADVALRHDDLENLVFENTSGFIVPAGRRNTSSIGAELGRIRSSGHKEWPVYKISEIDRTAEVIVQEFLSVGMPYLEKYSDKEILFRTVRAEWAGCEIIKCDSPAFVFEHNSVSLFIRKNRNIH